MQMQREKSVENVYFSISVYLKYEIDKLTHI